MIRSPRLQDVAAILLLGALTLFFFWRLLTPNLDDRLAMPRGDFTDQYYPLRHFTATTLARGELPFWNPHIFGGQPGLADPQAATFYPPALLNALLWRGGYSLFALETEAIAHLFWAALGGFLFLRRGIALPVAPSLFGALVWGFGGYLTGFPLEQVTILETVAWLPWLLLAVRGAVTSEHPSKQRWSVVGGALALGCAVLAGHPQSLLYLVYLAAAYALFLLWRAGELSRRARLVRGGWLAVLFALGVGLAAIQLLPTLAFIGESTRETLSYDFTSGGQSWGELLEILLPKIAGATPLYVGIVTLPLIAIGLLVREARSEKWFWAGAALVSLLLALGGNSVIYDLLYLGAPGFGSVRSQERALVGWVWSASLLAAWGVAALGVWAGSEQARRLTRLGAWWLPFFLLPLLVLWWLRALDFAQFSVNLEVLLAFFDRYTFFLVMLVLAWAVLAWLGRSGAERVNVVLGLLCALLLFDLFTITRAPHLGGEYEKALPRVNEVVEQLWAEPNVGRVGVVGNPIPQGNNGMRWGFAMLTGNEPLRLENSQNFFNNVPAVRQFQLLNVTHVAADIPLEQAELYEYVVASTQGAGSHLHRVRPQFPYAWWVGAVEQIEGRNALYGRLRSDDFDPLRQAVIDKALAPLAPDSARAAEAGTIAIEERRAGYARLRVRHDAEGALLLLFAEASAEGWVVEIDGTPARRERINAFNVGVVVPSGEHTVTLRYEQPRWREGLMITGLALLVVTGLALSAARPTRA